MRIAIVIVAAWLLAGCSTQYVVGQDGEVTTRTLASAKIHTELAAQYYELSQLGTALNELRLALQAESDYAPAYSVRGLVHMALHEDKEAEADFQHSLQLDDKNPETYNNYGWFLCQRGRERESVKLFLAALKDPLYATPGKAYLNAGLCSRKAGELSDAEEFLHKALLFNSGLQEAVLALAELNFAKGDYSAANTYFTRYAKDNDALTAENLWLGVRIEHELGNRGEEESYALQLRKHFPDSPESKHLPPEK